MLAAEPHFTIGRKIVKLNPVPEDVVSRSAGHAPFDPLAVAFWYEGGDLSYSQLVNRAVELGERLPSGPAAGNYCDLRDRFAIAFLALMVRGRTALLPPDRTLKTFQ